MFMGAAKLKSFTDKNSSKQVPKLPDDYCFSSRKWAKEGVRVIWHKQNQLNPNTEGILAEFPLKQQEIRTLAKSKMTF